VADERKVDVTPTDADFGVAFTRRFMGGAAAWASVKAEAKQEAAYRLLRENLAKQRKLIEGLSKLHGPEYIAEQARFDELLAEHEELTRIAFPSQFPEGHRG
jgi:hypothetical protein